MKQKLVVLSGAGISAESGLRTFRDSDGLWEGYEVTQVATPGAWRANPQLVLDFYNQRRRNVAEAQPNKAHHGLAGLENDFEVTIITQNIDDLHERAGFQQGGAPARRDLQNAQRKKRLPGLRYPRRHRMGPHS